VTIYEIAKEITVALVNKLAGQNSETLKTTSQAIGKAYKIIAKAVEEAHP